MRVVHISHSDCLGGASRSAYRTHLGLLEIGLDSTMLVERKASTLPSVIEVSRDCTLRDKLWNYIELDQIHLNRTSLTNSHFSYGRRGIDLTNHPAIRDADVIHLHWVTNFQSPASIGLLQRLSKPLVWTLHDQRAMTGGCHYTAGCTNFHSSCSHCPQLERDPYNVAAQSLNDQRTLVDSDRITIVGPSKWMAEAARKSAIFSKADIRSIPYGVEEQCFSPAVASDTRHRLGISADACVILFGADNPFEVRKGVALLGRALAKCYEAPSFRKKLADGDIVFAAFGPPAAEQLPVEIPIRFLGYISDDQELVAVYRMANIFVLPSLEDNLPNTILEAMSCAVPCVAFDTGGLPDMIRDGINGRLLKVGDADALATALYELIHAPELLRKMGQNAREEVERHFRLTQSATAYKELYEELLIRGTEQRECDVVAHRSRVESLFYPLLIRSARSIPRRIIRRARRSLGFRDPR
jgi:glycosyltransferase involved in cell wall biosynthesis